MSRVILQNPRGNEARSAATLELPSWIADRCELESAPWDGLPGARIAFRELAGNGCALFSARLRNAIELPAEELREGVVGIYSWILQNTQTENGFKPVRFWNFLPGIQDAMGEGEDRYMVFNAGRFAAFEARYGGRGAFDDRVATASAVGHGQSDLFVHCLGTEESARHVGNPRQVASYRYSEKFGKLPPCFARATVSAIRGKRVVLVGGTASICGEDSRHEDDLAGQFSETLENLSALIRSAGIRLADPLSSFRELRVYYLNESDREAVEAAISRAFVNVNRPEILRADLCRRELLVEIEGVAELPQG